MTALIITRRMRPLLGTYVEIGVQHHVDHVNVQQAIDCAFERMTDIHQQMSLFDISSVLSQLNFASGRWVNLPRDTLRVLKLARALTRASAQRFNCTVGGELLQRGALPRLSDEEFLLRGVADDIKIAASRARLLRPVYITLDGIAKGYAVDCACATLRRAGFADVWVNAGGDLRVCGKMQLPIWQRNTHGEQHPLGQLQHAAMASSHTSIDYNPDFPAQFVAEKAAERSEIVSVIAKMAWRADALTKVALATPLAQRADAIAQWRAVLIDEKTSCVA